MNLYLLLQKKMGRLYDMMPFLASSLSYPSSDTFFSLLPFPPFLLRIPNFTPTIIASLFAWFSCLWLRSLLDQTIIMYSCLFSLFFCGDVLGAAYVSRLYHWGGHIYSAWRKDNDLSRPQMKNIWSIVFNHIQNFLKPRSEQNGVVWL